MKFTIVTAAILATVAVAAPAAAQDVRIDNAVARVVVIVEDRIDIGVEIEQGRSALPALRVTRRGNDVRVDGGLDRNAVRDCRSGPADARQPGQGASVEVRRVGRVRLEDAPLVVIRSPRAVKVGAGNGVFGAVGPGASSVELAAGGCGDWTLANVAGKAEINLGGSGGVRLGTSRSLEVALGGSGDLVAGRTGAFELAIGGAGEVRVARVDGPVDIAIGGSGDVTIRDGMTDDLSVSIAGSGDVDFGGTARDVSVSIAGSGDVRVARATGNVSRTVIGSGDIRIGR